MAGMICTLRSIVSTHTNGVDWRNPVSGDNALETEWDTSGDNFDILVEGGPDKGDHVFCVEQASDDGVKYNLMGEGANLNRLAFEVSVDACCNFDVEIERQLFVKRAVKLGFKNVKIQINPNWYLGIENDYEEDVPRKYLVSMIGVNLSIDELLNYRSGVNYSEVERNWIAKQYLSWRHIDQISNRLRRSRGGVLGLLVKNHLAYHDATHQLTKDNESNIKWMRSVLLDKRRYTKRMLELHENKAPFFERDLSLECNDELFFITDADVEVQTKLTSIVAYFMGLEQALKLASDLGLHKPIYLLCLQLRRPYEGLVLLSSLGELRTNFQDYVRSKLCSYLRRETFDLISEQLHLWRANHNYRFELDQIVVGERYEKVIRFQELARFVCPAKGGLDELEVIAISFALLRDFESIYDLASRGSFIAQWVIINYIEFNPKKVFDFSIGADWCRDPIYSGKFRDIKVRYTSELNLNDRNLIPYYIFDYIESLFPFNPRDARLFGDRFSNQCGWDRSDTFTEIWH